MGNITNNFKTQIDFFRELLLNVTGALFFCVEI